jgi:nucleoside 2-deoxyribosyltransferase
VPENIRLFRILLAAPSDVTEERDLVATVIDDWNVQHGDGFKARAELMNWRTHAHPETGKRPQALINRQFADRADIVLAIFWKRFGTPTGKASSGTVEEIERAVRRGKKVMVYFSQRLAAAATSADKREEQQVMRFRVKFGRTALYETYDDVQEFQAMLRKDLALVLREVLAAARKKR